MKEKILKLDKEGKSYREIEKELGCSKGTISYHLGKGQKEKSKNRATKRRKTNPLQKKFENFTQKTKEIPKKDTISTFNKRLRNKFTDFTRSGNMNNITLEDIVEKIGPKPKCYLTGRDIDVSKPKTYSFDHIVPRTKGGENTLENLGIASCEANKAKNDLLLPDFIKLCEDVLINQGYEIKKPK